MRDIYETNNDKFRLFSGLKINLDKSVLLPLGSLKKNPPDISALHVKFANGTVRYLGILLSADLTNLFDLNFTPKLQKLKDILRIWSCRDLTPVGKIAVVKSLGLSQLIFLLSVLPDPPSLFIKELDSVIYKFIWSGKPDKVKRLTLIGNYAEGGLRMCHIPSLMKGLKIAWVKRLIDSDNTGKWKIFFNHYLQPFGGNLLWHCNMNQTEKCIDRINNVFVKNVVRSWCTVAYDSNINTMYDDQIIWNNSYIRIDNNIQYKCNWLNNGVKFLKDLMDDNGRYLMYNVFQAKYHRIKYNFMDNFALIHAIPRAWKKSNHMVDRVNHNSWQNELIEDMFTAITVLITLLKFKKTKTKQMLREGFSQQRLTKSR